MKIWTPAIGVLLIATGFGVHLWLRPPAWERCYSQIHRGMTVSQIRKLAGRDEDAADERKTQAGEFERSWSFGENGARITVVFDRNGQSIYKEFGPGFCGLRPLDWIALRDCGPATDRLLAGR